MAPVTLPPYLKLSEILEACVSPHVSASRVKTDLRNAGLLRRINERGHHRIESQALEARLRGYYDLVWNAFDRRARSRAAGAPDSIHSERSDRRASVAPGSSNRAS